MVKSTVKRTLDAVVAASCLSGGTRTLDLLLPGQTDLLLSYTQELGSLDPSRNVLLWEPLPTREVYCARKWSRAVRSSNICHVAGVAWTRWLGAT